MRLLRGILLSLIAMVALAVLTQAQIPRQLSYQGILTDSAGTPKPDGLYTLTFRFHTAESGGSVLWTESKALFVERGLFSTILGDANPFGIALTFDRPYWLSIQVEDQPQLSPRIPLTASAYSLNALRADTAMFVRSGSGTATGDSVRIAGMAASLRLPASCEIADPEYAMVVSNLSSGDGLRAYSQSTVADYGAVYAVNASPTGEGAAIVGRSLLGRGVFAMGDSMAGVDAQSIGGVGVYGASSGYFGVVANGNDDAFTDQVADLFLAGELGEIMSDGTVDVFSNTDVYVDLNNNDGTTLSFFAVFNGIDDAVFIVDETGNLVATGTKSAVVSTATSGDRLLYATESPEVWFEDAGTATLTGGTATVSFEKIFLETINPGAPYHVFVTPVSAEPVMLTVSQKTGTGFSVRGTLLDGRPANCPFDYRIMAKRLGYESVRLAPLESSRRTKRASGRPAVRPGLRSLERTHFTTGQH
jgi:hypothetical protein